MDKENVMCVGGGCVCVWVCTMQYLDALTLENYSLSEIQIELGVLHFIWQPHLHRCQN